MDTVSYEKKRKTEQDRIEREEARRRHIAEEWAMKNDPDFKLKYAPKQ